MELHELGAYLVERADSRIVNFTLRCLGHTALSLQTLLDEVGDTDEARARWGIDEAEEI